MPSGCTCLDTRRFPGGTAPSDVFLDTFAVMHFSCALDRAFNLHKKSVYRLYGDSSDSEGTFVWRGKKICPAYRRDCGEQATAEIELRCNVRRIRSLRICTFLCEEKNSHVDVFEAFGYVYRESWSLKCIADTMITKICATLVNKFSIIIYILLGFLYFLHIRFYVTRPKNDSTEITWL